MTEYHQKKEESDKRILQYLSEGKSSAHNSILYANTTIEELENQKETLKSIENHLDQQDEIMNQSLRKIRSMTWSGKFYNVYSDVVSTISSTITSSTTSDHDKSKPEKQASSTPQESGNSTPYEPKEQLLLPKEPVAVSEEDKLLDDIANAAAVLKQMGLAMGQQLDDHNQHLEVIESKTDHLHDKTLTVSIKASQLTQKQSKKDRYVGTFQFVSTSNSLLLSAEGDNLALTNSADPATLFHVILRQDTIVGLQNERTGKFVGITLWGSIAVGGKYFGSQEECFLDLTGSDTGILFIAKNWGAGGWLKVPALPDNMNGEVHVILNETTLSADDRESRLIVKAIRSK